MKLNDQIAHHKETVYQLCWCGSKLSRIEVEDHAGVCALCRWEMKK